MSLRVTYSAQWQLCHACLYASILLVLFCAENVSLKEVSIFIFLRSILVRTLKIQIFIVAVAAVVVFGDLLCMHNWWIYRWQWLKLLLQSRGEWRALGAVVAFSVYVENFISLFESSILSRNPTYHYNPCSLPLMCGVSWLIVISTSLRLSSVSWR